MEREWKREKWIKHPALHALSAHQSAAKTKSRNTVQVWPGMRQELSFRLAIIQTQEWTAFKKIISVSKLHLTEAAFLCWINKGVWSIPYLKMWWITEVDSDDIPCFNETQRFKKALTGPRVAFRWSFPLVHKQNLTNCYLETCGNCLLGYTRQPGWMELLCSCLHPVTALSFHSCRHLLQPVTADSERKAAIQHSTGEMLAGFLVSEFFPQNARSIHSVKEDCWTKFLPDHKYKNWRIDSFLGTQVYTFNYFLS